MTRSSTAYQRCDEESPWFTAIVHSDGGVELCGELATVSLDAFRAALDQALLEPVELVRIDASQLSFIDSAALTELLGYQLTAASLRRRLWLEQISSAVAESLDFLDLRHLLMVDVLGGSPSLA